MSFTLVTLTAGSTGFRNADGSVAKGTVTFQATAEMENGGQIRSPSVVTATLDNNGEIKIGGQGGTAVILAATDDTGTLPTGVTYTVVENFQAGAPIRVYQLAVPHASATLDLSTVAPALPATPAYPYLLTTGNGLSVVQYCSPAGSDANDGSTWRNAKKTFLAAYDALPAAGGTIYVTDNTTIGGTVANQGLWIAGPNDTQYNALPAGWRQVKSGGIRVVGVGNSSTEQFFRAPQALLSWGAGADKPPLWISGTGAGLHFENLAFANSIMWKRLGVDSASPAPYTTLRNSNTSGLWFRNCGHFNNGTSDPASGPGVDIGYLFWAFWEYCNFAANPNAQADRTADNRAAVLIKPLSNGPSTGLLFFDHCTGAGGGIKQYPGGTSWGLSVNDFVTEGDTGYAVWITNNNGYGNALLRAVSMADNPYAAAPTVKVDGVGPPEAVLCEGVTDVTGPATVLSGYPAKWTTLTRTPAGSGQTGFWQGRVSGQHDSNRRAFGPAAVRYSNLANHDSSLWSVGSATITTGITAPDGGTGAVRLSTGLGGAQSRNPFSGTLNLSSGDWLVAGFWYRAPSGSAGAYQAIGLLSIGSTATFTIGGNLLFLSAPLKGEGEWEWVALCGQIATGDAAAGVNFSLSCDSTHTNDFFTPVLFQIPTGTLSQSEVYELTQHLHATPKGAGVGTLATYAPLNVWSAADSRMLGKLVLGPDGTNGNFALGTSVGGGAYAVRNSAGIFGIEEVGIRQVMVINPQSGGGYIALDIGGGVGNSANYGHVNIGRPFDGVSAGKFAGSASSTLLALNADSGFAGNLLDLQVAGVRKFVLGAGGEIGFFGTAAQAKQSISGSRGGNAALADLLTKLATYGFLTDGTSA